MTTFYQITVNGKYSGQDVKNILWYRDASLFSDSAAFLGMANAALASVRDQCVKSQAPLHVRGRGLLEQLPEGYVCESLSLLAYSDAHLLISDTPVVLEVGLPGEIAGNTNGPSNYVALRAILEPSFGPGVGLPKKGYLAIGPIVDNMVINTGNLGPETLIGYNDLGNNLATNVVTTVPPSVLFPIRVKLVYSPHLPGEHGVLLSIGYKDIQDFIVRPIVKQRRSRLPEA